MLSGIGHHVQNCVKWGVVEPPDAEAVLLQVATNSSDEELTSNYSISSVSDDSNQDNKPPSAFSPPQNFDDAGSIAGMELDEQPDEALQYQEERAENDDEDDEDWWNEFCVPEPEEAIEEVNDDVEAFEELLHWIDHEMDLEIAQNSKHLATHISIC